MDCPYGYLGFEIDVDVVSVWKKNEKNASWFLSKKWENANIIYKMISHCIKTIASMKFIKNMKGQQLLSGLKTIEITHILAPPIQKTLRELCDGILSNLDD